MALVTICKYRRAKTPYFLEQAGLNMYSLEELAWFLYHNICLAEPQMFDDRLCRWLEEEGDLPAQTHIDDMSLPEGSMVKQIMVRIKLLPDND